MVDGGSRKLARRCLGKDSVIRLAVADGCHNGIGCHGELALDAENIALYRCGKGAFRRVGICDSAHLVRRNAATIMYERQAILIFISPLISGKKKVFLMNVKGPMLGLHILT